MIETLPIPRPFDLERFRLGLGRRRGRMLRLVPAPGPAGGLWIATADEDHVYYPRDAAPSAQLYTVAREIGHMLFEHDGGPAATSEIARLLLPALEPELVVSTLRSTGYSAHDTEEAELFAVLLLDYMEVEPEPSPMPLPVPSRCPVSPLPRGNTTARYDPALPKRDIRTSDA
jgi:hypothetical protein